MPTIELSKDEKAQLVRKLQQYLDDELQVELGQFDCEFLLDFISKEFGATYYNQGLSDAQALINKKLEDISDTLYELEMPV